MNIEEIFEEYGWSIFVKPDGDFSAMRGRMKANKNFDKISTWCEGKLRASAELKDLPDNIVESVVRLVAKMDYSEIGWQHPNWEGWCRTMGYAYGTANAQWIMVRKLGMITMKNDYTKILVDGKRYVIVRGTIEKEDLQELHDITEIIVHDMFK